MMRLLPRVYPLRNRPVLISVLTLAGSVAGGTDASIFNTNFDINLVYNSPVTAQQRAAFESAEATWENLITGYQVPIFWPSVNIAIQLSPIDGEGNALAQAFTTALTTFNGFRFAFEGRIQFDTSDLDALSDQAFQSVATHEIAHVLGFGTTWERNGVYTGGSGQYTGANALAAYQAEFDPFATFVPVELGGTPGTANAHWDEVDGGAIDTGITQASTGLDLRHEIMTGWHSTPTFISNTTVQSFADLGYTVVPEPNTLALMSLLGCLVTRRRR